RAHGRQSDIEPPPEFGIAQIVGGDPDVAGHDPSRTNLQALGAWVLQRLGLPVLADAEQQAALADARHHFVGDHECDAAEHGLLARATAGEGYAAPRQEYGRPRCTP